MKIVQESSRFLCVYGGGGGGGDMWYYCKFM